MNGTKNSAVCANSGCGAPLPMHERYCSACGQDIGFPNVRAANDPAEVAAVEVRYAQQSHAALAGGYEATIRRFEDALASSVAIICMPPARLQPLISDPDSLVSTFSLQLEGQSRIPRDNRFDAIRRSVEEAYFPNYSREIRFAALSLSKVGHTAYGSCSVTLKESAIASRASVFEYPLFTFAEKFGIKLGQPIPTGHRATWASRRRLATVKLGPELSKGKVDFGELLLPEPSDTLADCIEVHIYGPLSRFSFAGIVMREEKRREDRLLQRAISEKLARDGVSVEILK